MAKGKPDPQWQNKIRDWEVSGKSAKAWCQEHNIPMTTLSGWKKRLKIASTHSVKAQSGFIELKNRVQPDPGITLEYDGIKIHLEAEFNTAVLKQCLDCLRGALC